VKDHRERVRAGMVRAGARPRRRRAGAGTRSGPARRAAAECICSFGATRVGPMLKRLRLHVTTDRFLAGLRGDQMWEAACDYAALALARLASRLQPAALEAQIGGSQKDAGVVLPAMQEHFTAGARQ
jgi:hypothetical protein